MTTMFEVAPPRDSRQLTLGVLQAFFTRLHAEDVVYCHWKSNEHLRASMIGHTDLDLLFDRNHAAALSRILAELDFKRFAAVPGRAYPGIEDYLGLDPETGTLVHLHVHYRLTLGERYIKGYRLPWEGMLLAERVLDDEEGVYVADPALEALLLVTRMALKIRTRDRLASWRGRSYFAGGALRELRWLSARLNTQLVAERARSLVGESAAKKAADLVFESCPTVRQLIDYRKSIRPTLEWRRTYAPTEAKVRRWTREFRSLLARNRWTLEAGPVKRVNPRGGLLVAFVGADGAGKSTLTGEIARWLEGKLDVAIMYGGSGAGSAAWPRQTLQKAARFSRRIGARPGNVAGNARGSRPQNAASADISQWWRPSHLGRVLWAVALDRERRARLALTRRLTNLGALVIADRYPQSQFVGFNDGPRLAAWVERGPRLVRWAARHEHETFRMAEASSPDLVIKLLLPYEVAVMRKSDTPPAQLRRKVDVIHALRYPSSTRVVEIDAAAPLADVLREVKQAVWSCM